MKTPSYMDFNSRATNDVPLDVIPWQPPQDDSYVVVEESFTTELERLKAVLERLT
jgi:hypothetical protein